MGLEGTIIFANNSKFYRIVPYDHARSAGSKIYNFNVLKFKDARRGAVNGMSMYSTYEPHSRVRT